GLGILLEDWQITKMLSGYVCENKRYLQQYIDGGGDVEFVAQGTLAQRMRAGGCGIAAVYTRTGYGTPVAECKPPAEHDSRTYALERAIVADLALVHAHTADHYGNLRYRLTARNFNPLAAMCGQVTFAEAEHIVEPGGIGPDDIHTPGVFVQHLMQATAEKHIEQRTVHPRPGAPGTETQEVA